MDLLFGFLNLAVFYFISKTVGPVEGTDLNGAPTYFAFVTVGIVLTFVIQSANAALARRVREEQLTGTLEALLSQPLSVTQLALGLAGFPFVFAMLRALAYLFLAAAVFGLELGNADWVGLAAMLVSSTGAMMVIGILTAGVVMAVKRGESFTSLVYFALSFFAGSAFPREVLPSWASVLGSILPTRFAFDGTRSALFLGDGWQRDAIALVLFAAVGIPVAIAFFRQMLRFAVRRGSLGQY